jgi:hypothetical protein
MHDWPSLFISQAYTRKASNAFDTAAAAAAAATRTTNVGKEMRERRWDEAASAA